MVAIAHTLGMLQEEFPEEFASEPRYRLNWDKPAMCRCDVIAAAT